jgi:6-phosphogluconolactonase
MVSPFRAVGVLALVCVFQFAVQPLRADSLDVWIGTGGGASKGIYHCTLDSETGRLSAANLAAKIDRPGFLAKHPSLPMLYALGKLDGVDVVAAYRIENVASEQPTLGTTGKQKNGKKNIEPPRPKLTFVNSEPIGDGSGTHISVDQTGKTLVTAQYGGGSTAAFELAGDGSLRKQTLLVNHKGGSRVVARRQDAPHAHWCGFSPDNRFVFVPDLGLDQVVIYRHDLEQSSLAPHGVGQAMAGGGPRHMKFHPNGEWIYLLNELDLSVSVYQYDKDAGTMSAIQTIETVPKSETAKEKFKSASEVRVHPNGKFLYCANRGHDTITAFAIDPDTGKLSVIERENCRGATPRNFNLTPDAKWLLAAGQDSNTLAVFAVDSETGELQYNRSIVNVPAPICVLMEHE